MPRILDRNLSTLFRIRKPKGARKNWSLEKKEPEGSWTTVVSKELTALKEMYASGVLSYSQAELRINMLLEKLYEERDQASKLHATAGNLAIIEKFLREKYPNRVKLRLSEGSYEAEVYRLNLAVKGLGSVALDGDVGALQEKVDTVWIKQPKIHKRRVTSINRVRLWLNLESIRHLPRSGTHEVLYVTEDNLKLLLDDIKHESTKILAALLFYTGVRLGEAFAITKQDLVGPTLKISKQITSDGRETPTKTRMNRKALIIPGGLPWVEKWLALSPKERKRHAPHSKRVRKAGSKIVPGFYLHCLRHSYCVHLISKGCSLDWVAQSAGHSREVCERFYSTHILLDDSIKLMLDTLKK